MNLFLDTNALIKLYHEEKGSKNFYDFLYSYKKGMILSITDLSKLEFYSALYKEIRIGNLPYQNAQEIFNQFNYDL